MTKPIYENGMNNNEALEMLNRCKHEIMRMRETINQLKPKAEAYDNLVIVLNLLPRVSQGFAIDDLVWTIQKRIDELTPKPETNPAQTPTQTHKPDPEGRFNVDPYSPKNITEANNRIHNTE